MRRRNPGVAGYDRELTKAARVYEMWHEKEPDNHFLKANPFPRVMCPIGYADEIVYVSDKWEADGDFYDYIHAFSKPTIYSTDGERAVRDTARLLGVTSLDVPVPCVQLATVKYITYVDNDGEKYDIKFGGRRPMLCSTLDKKAVFVADRECPVIIRGKQMRVTARGIVK